MKKAQMVGTRLPRNLVEELERIEGVEQSDRSTVVRKLLVRAIDEWKLDHHARLYGEGRVTLARAARDAGVSIWEMMAHARNKKIAAQYDLDDLAHDLSYIVSSARARPTK